jgi:hypothetical protein
MAGRATADRVIAAPRMAPGKDTLEQNDVGDRRETKQ